MDFMFLSVGEQPRKNNVLTYEAHVKPKCQCLYIKVFWHTVVHVCSVSSVAAFLAQRQREQEQPRPSGLQSRKYLLPDLLQDLSASAWHQKFIINIGDVKVSMKGLNFTAEKVDKIYYKYILN